MGGSREKREQRRRRRPALLAFDLDALPIINHFLQRLQVQKFLDLYLPPPDRRCKLAPSTCLLILLRQILLARSPLYRVGLWARPFLPSLLGLSLVHVDELSEGTLLNDDQVGRALDELFDADRVSLLLALVTRAIREFHVPLKRFHNDSTSIKFFGHYDAATGRLRRGKRALHITYGFSKDHRPDLKQLLWSLTVADDPDAAVPVHHRALDGNTTDDQTHLETWKILCAIAGKKTFLYVADSKLCTRPNMQEIARQGGRFLTILPATRKEERRFRDWMQTHAVPWKEVLRRANPRAERQPQEIFRAYEDPAGSSEGFRIVWFHSSEKHKRDAHEREEKIDEAVRVLQKLKDRLASPKTRLRKPAQVYRQVEAILEKKGTGRWVRVHVQRRAEVRYRQMRRGRPAPTTGYRKILRNRFDVTWEPAPEALAYDRNTDGIFPLITCDPKMTAQSMLEAYKFGQPKVERQHHNLKGVREVAPQYLKSETRIEAFLAVYFVALLVDALIEREVRRGMRRRGRRALPLYPEGRPCKHPTAQQILGAFESLRAHWVESGRNRWWYYAPELNPLRKLLLRLLRVPRRAYRADR